MSSAKKRGSSRPNRGGGRFNTQTNARGRGSRQRGTAPRRPGGAGMARKQDRFEFDDEILEGATSYEHRPQPSTNRGRGRRKVQMQHIQMSSDNQDMVKEMLLALHASSGEPEADLCEEESSEYNDLHHWRAEDQYWTRDNQLVVEEAATNKAVSELDAEQIQYQRFTQLAVAKLRRYGFDTSRCKEALEQSDGDIGSSLEYLLSNAFDLPLNLTPDEDITPEGAMGVVDLENGEFEEEEVDDSSDTDWDDINEQRNEEKLALEAIYGDKFTERITNTVWTLSMDIPKLTQLAQEQTAGINKRNAEKRKIMDDRVCKYYLRGRCTFGTHCKFKHEIIYKPTDQVVKDDDIGDYHYQLEIRFPSKNRYPLETPYIAFQSTNTLIAPHVSLNVTARLVKEAKVLCSSLLPIVYTLVSLLDSDEEITSIFCMPPMRFSLPEPVRGNRKDNDNHQLPNRNARDNTTTGHTPPNSFDDVLRQIPGASKTKPGSKTYKDESEEHKPRDQDELHKKYGRADAIQQPLNKHEIHKLNRRLKERFAKVQDVGSYKEMQAVRQQLPAWTEQDHILKLLQHNQVLVVSGMTGCGKTTQVPQFILDASLRHDKGATLCNIVCTQPRRISAMAVADRVSAERAERVGGIVGYQIRLESVMSSRTRLLFCTTGILLRRLESDATLEGVSCVIVDEVHERTEESDFLMMILRDLLPSRPDLKVILMSATLNAELFSNYFRGCPVIDIPGRTYPVEQFFLEDIIETTRYVIDESSRFARPLKRMNAEKQKQQPSRLSVEEIDESLQNLNINALPPKNNIRDTNLGPKELFLRYSGYKKSTVKQMAIMDHEKVNFDLIEKLIEWICTADHDYPKKGAILVFLQGYNDIQTVYDMLQSNKQIGSKNKARYKIIPLHSTLSSEEQKSVFVRPPKGVTKIVLSTNIAETSVTIDDIVYVIDCGFMKEKRYDPSKSMESLDSVWISRANALQRKGRAGRVASGVCFHLFTGHRYDHHLKDQPVPEIQRVPLEQTVLRIKILHLFRGENVTDVLNRLIEGPSRDQLDCAIRRLKDLGALGPTGDLTPLGFHLAALPVDVRIGKLMLFGAIFRCLDAALTIAATLSYKSPFVAPFGKKSEATAKKCEFATGNSDHLTSLKAYQAYTKAAQRGYGAAHLFCSDNFISSKTIQMLGSMKRQFAELLSDIGFIQKGLSSRAMERMAAQGSDGVFLATGHTANCNSENMRLIAAILVAALYPNVVQVYSPQNTFQQGSQGAVPRAPKPEELRFKTKEDGYIFIHPSSVNFQVRYYDSPYLVYHEKIKTSKLFIRDSTMVSVYPLLLFGGGTISIDLDQGNFLLSVDEGWIRFMVSSHEVAQLIREVRLELDQLLQDKIENPHMDLCTCPRGNRIITTIVRLISTQ